MEDQIRLRIQDSGNRLVKLLALKAPDIVIAHELALLHHKAMILPQYRNFLMEEEERRARQYLGMCIQCGKELAWDRPDNMKVCLACAEENEKFLQEMSQVGDYDDSSDSDKIS